MNTKTTPALAFKSDWEQARQAHQAWWAHKGLALSIRAPRDPATIGPLPPLPPPADLRTRWLDPTQRALKSIREQAATFHGGAAFPIFRTDIGPGSLGLFLGGEGELAETTVWYPPVIHDPESHPPLVFDPTCEWFKIHRALLQHAIDANHGRYLVGYPDLIENLDVLAQLRGPEETLADLIDRPAWCEAKIREINPAFFQCYDALYGLLKDAWGGTAFCAFDLWGPGKTAKVQCDFCCMISPEMFRQFVTPCLTEQCEWLDNAMYHLDGTNALQQLPNLLAIEALDAIEWTPQAGLPGGGSPQWYELYRTIKRAGKSVQAIGVQPDEVLPLLDAVGPEGMYIISHAPTEAAARELLKKAGWPAA